jgi:hypothetical protein
MSDLPNLDILVRALLVQGHKVEAVAQVRHATGWGLRASKDYVDTLASSEGFPPEVEAPVDYTAFSDAALLAALEYAGRAPDPDLIRACLARPEALTARLLAFLQADENADWGDDELYWDEDDPRWYRGIHAGLLLCAYREPAALPIFARLLRDEEQDTLYEWFSYALPYYYGPLAVPMLIEMLDVQGDYDYPAISACGMLAYLALYHPEERERVIEALCQYLPSLDENGRLVLTAEERRDPPELWSWIANAFMDLKYEAAHDLVKALFAADVLEKMVFGDWQDYKMAFEPDAPPSLEANYVYDIIEDYENMRSWEQRTAQAAEEPSWGSALETAPVSSGPSRTYASSEAPFVHQSPRVGRNDPCPCGSGRKYKHCCGKRG